MSQKRKYGVLTASALLLFAYVLATEVSDRLLALLDLNQLVQQQESEIKPPEVLFSQKAELLSRKRLLLASATQGERSYEHSQTGVIEYLNHCAKTAGVRFITLTPVSSTPQGELTEITFSLSLEDEFISVGKLIRNIERGPLSCAITKLHIRILKPRNNKLNVSVEGRAHIFPRASS
jgi:hypothetical protein